MQANKLAFSSRKVYGLPMRDLKAVISGDLIASSVKGAAAIDAAMASLAETAADLSGLTESDTRFTRHRGDGWQIYVDVPGLALTCALAMAASLRRSGAGLDTRQAIGFGRVETLPPATLGGAFGEAFELSGRSLDQMPRGARLCLANRLIVTPWHEALIALIDWQSGRWSKEQAEAVLCRLLGARRPNADLAATLGITRQAFEARLSSAGFPALEPALHAFQSADWTEYPDV